MEREVRYCTTEDGVRIAYCVSGSGDPPIVWLADVLCSHVQREWEFAPIAKFYSALASRHALVRFDARGVGLSDRDVEDLSLDGRIRDIEAVADALKLDQFVLGGDEYGAQVATAYAAGHAERVTKLVLINPVDEASRDFSLPSSQTLGGLMVSDWEMFTENVGSLAIGWGKEQAHEFGQYVRDATSQRGALRAFSALSTADITELLPSIASPTLVVWTTADKISRAQGGRNIASLIPKARVRIIEGATSATIEAQAEAIGDFLGEQLVVPRGKEDQTPALVSLRTVLFTDLVGHTEMMSRLGDARGREVLREHERITRDVLKRHGGTEVKTMGDGFMASFGSVTKAVECAVALQRAFAEREGEPLSIRVGLNAGEPIEEDGDLFGATVILASRIAAKAGGGEILVANAVRELCAGKGLLFSDRGEFVAKGFDEPVRIYEVEWRHTTAS